MAKIKDIEVGVADVVDFMRITGTFAPALRQVVLRKVTADAARAAGIKVTSREIQKAADAFRVVNGLTKASDTEAWLRASGVTLEFMEDYLETNLLINKFKAHIQKKASKSKYVASPGIQESINEMMYQDWLAKALK